MKKLSQYLDQCTDLLLGELVNSSVIKVVNQSDRSKPKQYTVRSGNKADLSETGKAEAMQGVISDFYDFRNIIGNAYRNIKLLSPNPGNNPSLSVMMDGFIKLDVINPSWKDNELIRRFLDKAEDLLAIEKSKQDVLRALKSNKVNFTPLIIAVLEYYTAVSLQDVFGEGVIRTEVRKSRISETPDFIVNVPEAQPYLLIEVKYRKSKVYLREIIEQGLSQLNAYDGKSDKAYSSVFVVYTSGQLGDKERLIFSFKQNVEKRRLKSRIFFVPVLLGYLQDLVTDLTAMKDEILKQTTTDFTFITQPVSEKFPSIDDHYYDRALDLRKNNVEIRVKSVQSGHWRFGVKFSQSDSFPGKNERHPMNYPLIHLQKETDKDAISITHYDESGSNHQEVLTTISRYKNELMIIKIYQDGNELLLNVLDQFRKPIIDRPFSVGPYYYCWVSAWADNRNTFEFPTQIIEYAKS